MKNSILTIAVFAFTLVGSLEIAAQEFKSFRQKPNGYDGIS